MLSYEMQNPITIDKDRIFKVLVYKNDISIPIFNLKLNVNSKCQSHFLLTLIIKERIEKEL